METVPAFGTLGNDFATANITAVVGYSEITCKVLPFFSMFSQ